MLVPDIRVVLWLSDFAAMTPTTDQECQRQANARAERHPGG